MHCINNCHRNRNPRFNFQLCSSLCVHLPNSPVFIWPRQFPPPSPPSPPPPPANNPHPNTLLLLSLIATVTLVAAIFMLCLLFKKLIDRRNSRRNRHALFHARPENSPDHEPDGSVINHHIWYINTIGLQQSVIDSIAVFNYSKDEKLIDGSDCSICLGEFQHDDSLRLLPKCCHAFHVPCIDTWLRSHKNCPLCRAPVMSESDERNPTAIEPVTVTPLPVETEPVEGENREDSEIMKQRMPGTLRRSVSMDLVSAMGIHQETANLRNSEEGCSSMAISSSNNSGIGNQSLYNLVKSISFGRSVSKAAISMKRFGSGRRKLKGIRHYRSQSSVLPL